MSTSRSLASSAAFSLTFYLSSVENTDEVSGPFKTDSSTDSHSPGPIRSPMSANVA